MVGVIEMMTEDQKRAMDALWAEAVAKERKLKEKRAGRLVGCRGWGYDAGLPFYQMVIQADGEVTLCCHDVAARVVLGNVLDGGLARVWNGVRLRAAIERIYGGGHALVAGFHLQRVQPGGIRLRCEAH